MGRPRLVEDAKSLGVTITVDQREWLEAQAAIEDRTVSAIIRRLITEERERIAAKESDG